MRSFAFTLRNARMAVVVFVVPLLILSLAGVGCRPRTADQSIVEDAVPPSQPPPRDFVPTAGQRLESIRSPDGLWHAWSEYMVDDTSLMILEGPSYRRAFPIASPIAFSPDSTAFVYTAAPSDLRTGLYVLPIPPGDSLPRRITNVGVKRTNPFPSNWVPFPENTDVTWSGRRVTYTVKGDGTFTVDIDSGEVVRGAP